MDLGSILLHNSRRIFGDLLLQPDTLHHQPKVKTTVVSAGGKSTAPHLEALADKFT